MVAKYITKKIQYNALQLHEKEEIQKDAIIAKRNNLLMRLHYPKQSAIWLGDLYMIEFLSETQVICWGGIKDKRCKGSIRPDLIISWS